MSDEDREMVGVLGALQRERRRPAARALISTVAAQQSEPTTCADAIAYTVAEGDLR